MGLGRVWMGKVGVVVGLSLALAVTSGCSTKKGEGEASGLGEDSLGGSGSLSEFNKSGTVGAGGRFEEVYFAYDSADLDSAGTEATRSNAELLRREQGKVEIEGHCDDRGTAEYNLALGARRANAVKDYLVSRGVTADRLQTISYGEERPKYDNAREETRRLNRRAALVVRLQ